MNKNEMKPDNNGDPILCRANIDAPARADDVMYMPGGLHSITPTQSGRSILVQVLVDKASAQALDTQRQSVMSKTGKRPYFDFNHEDRAASFWPEKFYWDNGRNGVFAKGEWSRSGQEGIEGKDWRQFSPVFYVDSAKNKPAKIICNEYAKPNMGGLVNDPAFHDILPFWAKSAGASSEENNKQKENEMTPEQIAALQAKNTELENDVITLTQECEHMRMKNENVDLVEAKIAAKEAEIDANDSKLENDRLQAEVKKVREEIRARNSVAAKDAVSDAIRRGVIAPLDTDTIDKWEKTITEHPEQAALLGKMQGNSVLVGLPHRSTRITRTPAAIRSDMEIVGEDPRKVFETLMSLTARQGKSSSPETKGELARTYGAIFAREFKGAQRDRMLDFPLSAIVAGDSTDTNLGTLAGTLVTQRTLELLKFQFPSLTRFTTDFSDQPASFNQTVMSRIVTVPAVSDYNTSTGWTASTATTTDVPVTIDHHRGVPITFNANILASTARRLFEEFAPAQAYALAKDLVDKLYANITDANFTNNTVSTTATFTRAKVAGLSTALTLRGVPIGAGARTLLLYSTLFQNLVTDTALVTFAAYQKPALVTEPQNGPMLVIPVDTFDVVNAPNLPTNNGNVTGFAGSKSALVIATRVPNDYSSALPGASFGNVQVVTDPDIGISVQLVQYVNHLLGNASSRIAIMYGTASGQGNAGQLLKSATGSGSGQ